MTTPALLSVESQLAQAIEALRTLHDRTYDADGLNLTARAKARLVIAAYDAAQGCASDAEGRMPGASNTPAIGEQNEAQPVAWPFARPVSVDTIIGDCAWGQYDAYALFDANGKSICDTLNSCLITIEEDGDEDGVRKWDEVGRKNMERIAELINGAHNSNRTESAVSPLSNSEPFDKRCADALADEVAVLVRRGVIDMRSPAADALLDYRNPPSSPRADRLAALEAQPPDRGRQFADDKQAAGWRIQAIYDPASGRASAISNEDCKPGPLQNAWIILASHDTAPSLGEGQVACDPKGLIDHTGMENSRELCECPKCGRNHWKLGDPPAAIASGLSADARDAEFGKWVREHAPGYYITLKKYMSDARSTQSAQQATDPT